jgi:hypothetical protein
LAVVGSAPAQAVNEQYLELNRMLKEAS